ncbi:MAG: ribonuclease H family protein [Saprospiraceae bacterium]|nr:ribonuclease H family protein [Saprospiraceae bacterium]MBL0024471.1 ribonuclease H family protein [Saprospiraceae bacterium]
MAKKQKYYVVWEGNVPGIYKSWEECQKQIFGHPAAKYKAFDNLAEAEYAQKRSYFEFLKKSVSKPQTKKQNKSEIIADSISVDAACSGNPGRMEYQCVETISGRQVFHQGPYEDGTNNIGEFLGLVHALALLKKLNNEHTIIYTDSLTAMSWVKNKKVKTSLEKTSKNSIIFALIDRALLWLKQNDHKTKMLKWNTESWGEIPADFGRK